MKSLRIIDSTDKPLFFQWLSDDNLRGGEMTDDINETIARWCGIKPELDLGELMDSEVEVYRIPNFLDPIKGLGLLMKYIVSKLPSNEYHIGLSRCVGQDNFQAHIVYLPNNTGNNEWEYTDKDPTTALCMAVYKLIKEIENG